MILLDAVYINNSGGKVLLDHLIAKLNESEMDVFYLLDLRVKGDFEFLPVDKVLYLKNSMIKRHFFYRSNANKYKTVLCFGNIPPSIRLNSRVYTYFHNSIYFFTTKEFSIKERLLINLKSKIIRAFKHNTDKWWVQTDEMVHLFSKFWNINTEDLDVLPFFPSKNSHEINELNRERNSFLYISDGHPNKMHLHLLEAFKEVHKLHSDAKLFLTISRQYPVLLEKIKQFKEEGYGVVNLGWCNLEKLDELYRNKSFFIFPSNQESFGLGLIEASQYNMKILASNMPFVKAVIKPSLVFNPHNTKEIADVMITAMNKELPDAKLLVKNEINIILEKLA